MEPLECTCGVRSFILMLDKASAKIQTYFEECDCVTCHAPEYAHDEFDDDFDDYDYDYADQAMLREEHYEFKSSTKGLRGSSVASLKRKEINKSKRKQVKACVERKKTLRNEEILAQLITRKERLRERCRLAVERHYIAHGHYAPTSKPAKLKKRVPKVTYHSRSKEERSVLNTSSGGHNLFGGHQETLLSAEELGIETGSMYDRLVEIMNGGNITPEDFDLLLQLDAMNEKTTLDAKVIKDFDTVSVQTALDTAVVMSDARCVVCLDSFENMPMDSPLRCLPCGHIFCKPCIDEWLGSVSSKCPDLSCYWNSCDENISLNQVQTGNQGAQAPLVLV
eukprot:CAMPEP_0114399388 /NCGR_PEP_ID=MMETSP0102-20121206/15565_1 /TAXON_ID=38822 ORGANISM="Pteridomonas danica, Strain PT" /NCGR_SAMPLE_ID=MMETSP0102 /ASSEMBLY_ACC=CAM_ASM_000212 /LENGTH=336 /DNA_ID=CAMNT_0001561151 /DNA_START=15 /DNA_END=1025 /DNA_ORIENTATION=-